MDSYSKKITILDTADSTNNYAMALIKKGEAVNGSGIFALEQTGGKGRRGKEWASNTGDNIILSILTEMQWQPSYKQFPLIVAVALGCHHFINKHINENVRIKWPNDLIINDSKAGGILIENVVKGTLWQWAVIGIGININQVSFAQYPFSATSFKQITGKNYNVIEKAEELKNIVLEYIAELKEGGFDNMLQKYNELLYARNRLVKLKSGNSVFTTCIKEVSPLGQLITQDTLERQFDFGSIEFKGFA